MKKKSRVLCCLIPATIFIPYAIAHGYWLEHLNVKGVAIAKVELSIEYNIESEQVVDLKENDKSTSKESNVIKENIKQEDNKEKVKQPMIDDKEEKVKMKEQQQTEKIKVEDKQATKENEIELQKSLGEENKSESLDTPQNSQAETKRIMEEESTKDDQEITVRNN